MKKFPPCIKRQESEEDQYWQTASQVHHEVSGENQTVQRQHGSKLPNEKPNRTASINRKFPIQLLCIIRAQVPAENPTAVAATGIIYKIQIGAYKGKIPESANKLIKKFQSSEKLKTIWMKKGLRYIPQEI